MTTTMVRPGLRLVREEGLGRMGRHSVWNSERRVGSITNYFIDHPHRTGRFLKIWRSVCTDCFRASDRCGTRRDALHWLKIHRGWPV